MPATQPVPRAPSPLLAAYHDAYRAACGITSDVDDATLLAELADASITTPEQATTRGRNDARAAQPAMSPRLRRPPR